MERKTVHRRSNDARALAGQERGRQHIISEPVCQLGADIGSRRGDDREVGFLCQFHVLYFKFKIPVKGICQAFIDGQGFKRQWSNKLHRIFCHDDMHIGVLFL